MKERKVSQLVLVLRQLKPRALPFRILRLIILVAKLLVRRVLSYIKPSDMMFEWDERAKKNVQYFIATDDYQTEEAFDASGVRDVGMILSDVEHHLTKDSIVLEIGCGIGRLLKPLSNRFKELYGVDVSPQMIRRGRKRLKNFPNIHLYETSGRDLAFLKDNTFDFCFSYITFQHIPKKAIIKNYIKEALRVLKPGGIFKFQVHGFYGRSFRQRALELLRTPDTWTGVRFTKSEIVKVTRKCGFTVLNAYHYNDSEQYLWVVARKSY